jgi:hypothetical protein
MKKLKIKVAEAPLQIVCFEILGLFNKFHHTVNFPKAPLNSLAPEVVIMVGGNGVGKTTILNIIKGLLLLDFSPLRSIPFKNVKLTFSDNSVLEVKKINIGDPLQVSYAGLNAILHAEHSGAATPEEAFSVEKFRNKLLPILATINFECQSALKFDPPSASKIDPPQAVGF